MRKVALVTGSTRGIGFGIAKVLGENGYHVIISGTQPEQVNQQALARLDGISHEYFQLNIADLDNQKTMFEHIQNRLGRLDVLVNNAGVAPLVRADLLETSPESFDRVLDINLRGTFFMCQQAANLMLIMQAQALEDYHPRIINISSISAYTSSVNRPEYCISKAGISMVTALFADRLADAGIPVFEIRPGIIQTDMTKAVTEKYQRLIEGGITPVRRFGQPEDVAQAVLAVCSGLMDFTTGQIINADGGFHLRRL